ncbi:nitrilase-related carbon-nitrogen hydrolase [Streptomyces sp. NBC_01429]|uniref:nitrilase-related carbon-nitrogen hydrolase n=1 Tax=Streptomyces sp. NBC_01429 TaxID=2903862 RepID=UPI002E2D1274|nr:nitrilase-related carbon-nitrogen hydrolase [Streptomyces sp. NBC_01429]
MSNSLTVAAAQFEMREVDGFGAFAGQVRGLLDRTDGADLVVLPELFTAALFTARPGWRADPVGELSRIADYTDDYGALFQDLARTRGQVIVAGSHLVRAPDGDGVHNTAFVFFPDGSVVRHIKTHIFPAEAGWGTGEGDALEPFRVGSVTVGVSICYETEIPEVATVLTRKGADLIVSPSYTFTPAGFWRVRHCAQARAIENQVYVVHCPTTGDPGAPLSPGRGRSSVLGPCDAGFAPDGVLAEAAPDTQDVVMARLDLDLLHENRRTGAATTHTDRRRRASVYRDYADELLAGL